MMGKIANAFPLNRVVVLLTPIFAGIAGWIVTRVGEAMPGVNLDEGELTALFIAAFLAATEMARQWLIGHRKHEENEVLLELNGVPVSKAGEENRERAAEEGIYVGAAPGDLYTTGGGVPPVPEGAVGGKPGMQQP
jgi:hypothetical protein